MAVECTRCGSLQTAGDAFCGNCGQPIAGVSSSVGSSARAGDRSPATRLTDVVPAPEVPQSRPAWPGDSEPQWTGQRQGGTHALPQDVALGEATPNATYLGQRLLYKEPEAPFDPLGNGAILRQIGMRWLLYIFAYFLGAILAAIPCALLAFAGGIGLVLWVIGAVVTWIVLLCLFWLLPVPALLSEWKFSVDGAAAAAPKTFEHIIWSLQRRRTPLDQLQVRRLTLPGEGKRDYLELRQGLFAGYVACFPYGEDLYVGWTLWVRLSPLRLVLMWLARVWHIVTGKGSDLFVTLRYDSARAMREAMHSTAREGIDVAVGEIPAQGQGIIGTAVSVTSVDL
jgi:hypothetical protein